MDTNIACTYQHSIYTVAPSDTQKRRFQFDNTRDLKRCLLACAHWTFKREWQTAYTNSKLTLLYLALLQFNRTRFVFLFLFVPYLSSFSYFFFSSRLFWFCIFYIIIFCCCSKTNIHPYINWRAMCVGLYTKAIYTIFYDLQKLKMTTSKIKAVRRQTQTRTFNPLHTRASLALQQTNIWANCSSNISLLRIWYKCASLGVCMYEICG